MRQERRQEGILNLQLLAWGALSHTFKHLSGSNLLYQLPTGSLDTKYQVFISYPAPTHEWQQHGYLFFHVEQFSAEITALFFWTKNI